MSVNYYAYAIIGLKVDTVKLYKPAYFRQCEHNLESFPKEIKFCPVCGKKIFELEPVPLFKEDINGEYVLENQTVHWATDREYAVIGNLIVNTETIIDITKEIDLKSYKEKLKELTTKYNLWKEENFGLQALLSCSY